MCAFQKHCNLVLNSSNSCIKPYPIVQNLKGKEVVFGVSFEVLTYFSHSLVHIMCEH